MTINWKNKIWKIGIAVALVTVLAISMAVPALAKGGDKAASGASGVTAANTLNVVKGKVTAIDTAGSTFEVQPASGDAVTITVDTNTKFYQVNAGSANLPAIKAQVKERVQQMQQARQDLKTKGNNNTNQRGLGNKNTAPATTQATTNTNTAEVDEANDPEELLEMEAGLQANTEAPQGFFGKFKAIFNRGPKFGQTAAFTDLVVGDGVVVNVMPNENLAKQVLIVKASNLETVKGEITDVNADSFTVTAADDTEVTLQWDANTRVTIKGAISIEVGQYAQAVYNSETLIAKTINVRLEAPPTPTVATPTT